MFQPSPFNSVEGQPRAAGSFAASKKKKKMKEGTILKQNFGVFVFNESNHDNAIFRKSLRSRVEFRQIIDALVLQTISTFNPSIPKDFKVSRISINPSTFLFGRSSLDIRRRAGYPSALRQCAS